MQRIRSLLGCCLIGTPAALASMQASAQCDPIQIVELHAADGAAGDEFGFSVAFDGTTGLVGAPYDDEVAGATGAAFTFARNASGDWEQTGKLVASSIVSNGQFGGAVAIEGDTALIGAGGDNQFGNSSGAVFVFIRDHSGDWNEVQKLTASDAGFGDHFGTAVAIDDGLVVIGAYLESSNGAASGAAYIFQKDANGDWVETQKMVPSDPAVNQHFGLVVALDDDSIFVGASGDGDLGADAGAIYVFEEDGNGDWVESQKLTASDGAAGDQFGLAIDASDELLIIGARAEDELGDSSGAAYLFSRDTGGAWVEDQKLVASDGGDFQFFGWAVGVSGGNVLIGAPRGEIGGVATGAIYLFNDDGTGQWQEQGKAGGAGAGPLDIIGATLALHDDTAFVGARWDDDRGVDAGSSYVFNLDCYSALLLQFGFNFGAHSGGDIFDLESSDDRWLRGKSQFGFSALEPNITEVLIEATIPGATLPTSLEISVESRINNPGGSAVVKLRNWKRMQLEEVHAYALEQTDTLESIQGVDATDRVSLTNHQVDLAIRHSVIATFSAKGFDSFFDLVEIRRE